MKRRSTDRSQLHDGAAELARIRNHSLWLYTAVGVFSCVVNLLMLAGPLYMLTVYDRVLGSRSVETLVALTVLIALLYLCMAVLDHARSRVMARAGARLQTALEQRVLQASLSSAPGAQQHCHTAQADLEALRQFVAAPGVMALFDLPWSPLFFAGIFMFHPALGGLALAGAVLLSALALLGQLATRTALGEAHRQAQHAALMGTHMREEADLIRALGMARHGFAHWMHRRQMGLRAAMRASDRAGGVAVLIRTLRLFMQSAMLGLGAWLVLERQLTPGAMVASSILLGRALAPIETLVQSLGGFARARSAWVSLRHLLSHCPPPTRKTPLPRPEARIEVAQLSVIPPGARSHGLRAVSFRAQAGQAVGVIGPSGAGKSTLARALTGVWAPSAGRVLLDGAALDQYDPEVLGSYMGYLPQQVHLFEGSITENIARMAQTPHADAVVAAAQSADAHEMILELPEGYDTQIQAGGAPLSGGQVQRIGLARALYGDPLVLVLDEPNSSLDNFGTQALNRAVERAKSDGRVVFIMAHRPAAIESCDQLLVLEGGRRRAFGPRDQILRDMVANHQSLKGGIA